MAKQNKFPIYNAGYETVKEYLNGTRFTLRKPDLRVKISPFYPPLLPVELVGKNVGDIIQSFSFSKGLSQAAGQFTMSLSGANNALTSAIKNPALSQFYARNGIDMPEILKPFTFLLADLDGYSQFNGQVATINRSVNESDRRPIWNVSGYELGDLYNRSPIRTTLIDKLCTETTIISAPDLIMATLGARTTNVNVPLAINYLCNLFWLTTLNQTSSFPPFVALSDGLPAAMRMIAQPPPLGGIAQNSYLANVVVDAPLRDTGGQSSFWSYLKSLAAEPFMELFTESGGRTIAVGHTGLAGFADPASAGTIATSALPAVPRVGLGIAPLLPGFSYVILRSAPYDIPWIGMSSIPWLTLYPFMLSTIDLLLAGDYAIITDDDLIDKEIGNSGLNQNTIFECTVGGKDVLVGGGARQRPIICGGPLLPMFPGGIKSYGLRHYTASINEVSSLNGGIGTWYVDYMTRSTIAHQMSSLLAVWFRNASKFREGTVTIRSKPYIRPGMILLYLKPRSGTKPDYERDLGLYYIEDVTHSYAIGSNPTTTMTIKRGVPLPLNASEITTLLRDWEVLPPGFNLTDGSNFSVG